MSKKKKMVFTLVITRDQYDPKVFNVDVPEILGCHTFGDSLKEAIQNAKEAILTCLEAEDDVATSPHPADIFQVEVSV